LVGGLPSAVRIDCDYGFWPAGEGHINRREMV